MTGPLTAQLLDEDRLPVWLTLAIIALVLVGGYPRRAARTPIDRTRREHTLVWRQDREDTGDGIRD